MSESYEANYDRPREEDAFRDENPEMPPRDDVQQDGISDLTQSIQEKAEDALPVVSDVIDRGRELGTAAFERARDFTEQRPAVGMGVVLIAVALAAFGLGTVVGGRRR